MGPTQVPCFICPDVKGLIVETNMGWAHMTCINYIPEIWFSDKSRRMVTGKIDQDRKGLPCHLCKLVAGKNSKKYLIQCDFKNCRLSFHIRCAMQHGLIKSWEDMLKHRETDKSTDLFIFC